MRKMITFTEMSYNPDHWQKLITWGDPDTAQWRGSKINEKGDAIERAISDAHIMFVLRATKTPSQINLITIGTELDHKTLSMNQGGDVFVGNGFIYFDTRLGDVSN